MCCPPHLLSVQYRMPPFSLCGSELFVQARLCDDVLSPFFTMNTSIRCLSIVHGGFATSSLAGNKVGQWPFLVDRFPISCVSFVELGIAFGFRWICRVASTCVKLEGRRQWSFRPPAPNTQPFFAFNLGKESQGVPSTSSYYLMSTAESNHVEIR